MTIIVVTTALAVCSGLTTAGGNLCCKRTGSGYSWLPEPYGLCHN